MQLLTLPGSPFIHGNGERIWQLSLKYILCWMYIIICIYNIYSSNSHFFLIIRMSCREQPSFIYISWVQSYWNCSARSSIITHICGSGIYYFSSIAIADHCGHNDHSFFADVDEVSQFVAYYFCPYGWSYITNSTKAPNTTSLYHQSKRNCSWLGGSTV